MAAKLPSETERRASHDGVDRGLTSEDDAAVLASLGYKQELRRYTAAGTIGMACKAKQCLEISR